MVHYVDDPAYHRLVDALSRLQPDPFTGRIERDQIVTTLGEIGDIWPRAILADVARAWWAECNPPASRSLYRTGRPNAASIQSAVEPST